MPDFNTILQKASSGTQLNQQAIVTLLSANAEQMPALFAAANRVRRTHVGEEVHLRAIVEFSNYCRKNCLYCGLRRDNQALPRYRLTEQEILAAVEQATNLGLRTVVLQSGEDIYYSAIDLARLIEQIKNKYAVAVTLSLGERSWEDYKIWRESGADRYLLKQETVDDKLFQYLKPDSTLQNRVQCLHWLKELGYQTGSGNMVNLPGQNLDTLAKDILLMRDLDVEMAGIGPFLPHQATPLKDAPAGNLELTLKTLAVARLCLPNAHMPATTSLCTLTPNGHRLALNSGANVIMPNLTPLDVRDKYLIYPQKADIIEQPDLALGNITALLAELARPLAQNNGHAPKLSGGNYHGKNAGPFYQ